MQEHANIHVHVYTENIQRIYRDKIQCTESILRLNTTIYMYKHTCVHVSKNTCTNILYRKQL